jgi:pimeloyl-ACP methyl ester carboxylesterase
MSDEPTWVEAQRRHVRLSSNSRLITVNNSGHYIQLDQPEQVVAAVLDVFGGTPN